MDPKSAELAERLGVEFENLKDLEAALKHRSWVAEHPGNHPNERLEFLGDAVLELVVTDYLYRNYDEPEGILTNWRSALVRTESIGAAGDELGYAPLIRLSRGEKQGSDRARQQILANAFEAVIGAVYLEKGYGVAAEIINKFILSKLQGILDVGSWRDPKSNLQEVMQRVDGHTPQYRVISEEGPDHDKTFTLGVFRGDEMVGRGTGPNKQAAQQIAAKDALALYASKSSQTER